MSTTIGKDEKACQLVPGRTYGCIVGSGWITWNRAPVLRPPFMMKDEGTVRNPALMLDRENRIAGSCGPVGPHAIK
jgi:hypothetical protein